MTDTNEGAGLWTLLRLKNSGFYSRCTFKKSGRLRFLFGRWTDILAVLEQPRLNWESKFVYRLFPRSLFKIDQWQVRRIGALSLVSTWLNQINPYGGRMKFALNLTSGMFCETVAAVAPMTENFFWAGPRFMLYILGSSSPYPMSCSMQFNLSEWQY